MNSVNLIVLMVTIACVTASSASELPSSLSNKPSCCTKEIAPGSPLSDRSLYQIDSVWTNDSGAGAKFAMLRGRPQVVTMFFANCEYACPILVNDMRRIEAALPENLRTNIGFVLISFDSQRDTPATLAQYRKVHGLAANWTLLRGAPDDVLELATLLGIKFKKDWRGQFSHSNAITVLDADGEIVEQVMGLNRDSAEAVKAVERAVVSGGKGGTSRTE